MNLEKYTQKLQTILQSAQTIALGSGHQKFLPEHILKALLEDSDRLTEKLIIAADGNAELIKAETQQSLKKIPQVSGSGAGNITMSQEAARIFLSAEQLASKFGYSFLTVEILLLAILEDDKNEAAQILKSGGMSISSLRNAVKQIRAGK